MLVERCKQTLHQGGTAKRSRAGQRKRLVFDENLHQSHRPEGENMAAKIIRSMPLRAVAFTVELSDISHRSTLQLFILPDAGAVMVSRRFQESISYVGGRSSRSIALTPVEAAPFLPRYAGFTLSIMAFKLQAAVPGECGA